MGTVKDAQTQLRHSSATTTMNVYTQEIPSSVKATVEALDQKLFGVLNTIEHEFNGTPGRTRTFDPLLRRQVLYPPELRALKDLCGLAFGRSKYRREILG